MRDQGRQRLEKPIRWFYALPLLLAWPGDRRPLDPLTTSPHREQPPSFRTLFKSVDGVSIRTLRFLFGGYGGVLWRSRSGL